MILGAFQISQVAPWSVLLRPIEPEQGNPLAQIKSQEQPTGAQKVLEIETQASLKWALGRRRIPKERK